MARISPHKIADFIGVSSKNCFNLLEFFTALPVFLLAVSLTVPVTVFAFMVQIWFMRAKCRRENSSDTWRGGRWDGSQAGQTCRTDAARHRAAGSNESPKTKAPLPAPASARAKHPAKPICRRPRPIHIGSATASASSSRPHPWATGDWRNAGQNRPVCLMIAGWRLLEPLLQ